MRVRGGWWSRYGHSRLGSGSPGRCGAGRLLYSIRQSWTSTRASRRVLKASTASSSSRRRPPKLSTAELQDLLVAPRRVGGGCVSHGAMIPLPSRRRGAGSHNLQLPTWLLVLASDPLPLSTPDGHNVIGVIQHEPAETCPRDSITPPLTVPTPAETKECMAGRA
jgi:hypothetical protein